MSQTYCGRREGEGENTFSERRMNLCQNVGRTNEIVNLQIATHYRSHVHDIIVSELVPRTIIMQWLWMCYEALSTASVQLDYDLRPDQELAIKHHPRNEEGNRKHARTSIATWSITPTYLIGICGQSHMENM